MLPGDITRIVGGFDLVDINRRDEDIVRDCRKQAIGQEESAGLYLQRHRQDPLNHRAEQMQIMDHADHDEKDAEQGHEGQ